MIGTPTGWFRQTRADSVHLRAPRDRPVGEFRYREYYGPLRTARQVVDAKIASVKIDNLETLTVHPPQRLVTLEGEYAALVRIDAAVMKHPARRVMGIVFGDRFTTLLDGMSIQPALFDEFEDTARDLVVGTRLVLGVRRRRFVYAPPDDWQAMQNTFVTNWIPPDFPRNDARIIVTPATPLAQEAAAVVRQVVDEQRNRGSEVARVSASETTATRHGLSGLRWRIETHPPLKPPLVQEVAVFEDKRYTYALRVDLVESTSSASSLETFREVCASVEPIPDPKTIAADAKEALFSLWAD